MARPIGILMVCLGNICRSPMAEGVLRLRLEEAGLGGRVRVDSAATGSSHLDCPPDERAIATAARNGVDIAAQRARRLVAEDFDEFDIILCADRTILHDARIRKPRTSHGQVELLHSDISDWSITFVDTGAESPIGERLRRVGKFLEDDEYFLANYADVLTDAPMNHIIDEVKASGAAGSIGLAKCAFIPAAAEACASSAKALAVMATMGTAAASGRGSARSARAASSPFSTGMRISMMTAK